MSTHPTILGEMIRQEALEDEKTSLEVERDLALPPDLGEAEQADPARDLAIPPSDLPQAERQPDLPAGGRTGAR